MEVVGDPCSRLSLPSHDFSEPQADPADPNGIGCRALEMQTWICGHRCGSHLASCYELPTHVAAPAIRTLISSQECRLDFDSVSLCCLSLSVKISAH